MISLFGRSAVAIRTNESEKAGVGRWQSGLDGDAQGWKGKMGRAEMLVVTVSRKGVKCKREWCVKVVRRYRLPVKR